MTGVRRIDPVFVERVWGRTDLSPLYGLQQKRIGEVWFSPAPDFPLLVKFIFTSEKLSVQVHPNDEFAREHEGSRGKTEMWHILAAESDARIALGLKQSIAPEHFRTVIEDGTVMDLLEWVPVHAGETYFAPAGTVHAIGQGIVLCEVQQNSDVTYRLYDYGRRRELHLEKGLRVCDTDVYEGRRELPVKCPHFVTELLDLARPAACEVRRDHLLIALEGCAQISDASGRETFRAGECWFVPAERTDVVVSGDGGARVLRTFTPET